MLGQILINLIGGAIGGNASGAALKQFDMGALLNTIAGAVGGGVLGQILTALIPVLQSGNMDVGSIIGQLVGGGAGGVILQIIAGLIKNKMA